MEDQVQFANVLETSVEYLYKHLDEVEYTELALVLVHHKDKIESCIVSVNDTYVSSTVSVCLLQQRRHRKEGGRVLVLALSHQRVHLFKQRLLLVDGEPRVAAQQPWNAVVVEDEHRMDHSVCVCVCVVGWVLCVVCLPTGCAVVSRGSCLFSDLDLQLRLSFCSFCSFSCSCSFCCQH